MEKFFRKVIKEMDSMTKDIEAERIRQKEVRENGARATKTRFKL